MAGIENKIRKAEQARKGRRIMLTICGVVGLLGIVACGYGHAARSTDLMISGIATLEGSGGFGIDYMQDMTLAICRTAPTYTTSMLKDKRDQKSYWVTKMADGNCWMTQNLALELNQNNYLYTTTSAITSNWRPTYTTLTEVTSSTILNDAAGTKSWNFNDYVIKNPNASSSCGTKKSSPADCSNAFIAVGNRAASTDPNFYTKNGSTYTATEYDAHYLVGNFYQYNAVTAGKGAALASGVTTASICPKGWKLPGSQSTDTYSYANLRVKEGNITYATLVSPPYFLGRVGYIQQNTNLYTDAGSRIYTWEDRVATSANANAFFVAGSGSDATSISKSWALAVRCVFVAA